MSSKIIPMDFDTLSLLQAVFESTAEGILVVDNNGKVIQFNDCFKKLWRIPQDILDTRDDEKLLNFILDQLCDPDQFISKVVELYKDPLAISEDQIEFKDGRFFERHSRPLKMGVKNVGRLWNFRDTTQQKQSQEVFAAITELSPDIISIISSEGKLIFNSKAAERIHGYTEVEMIGGNTLDLIHPDDREYITSELKYLFDHPGTLRTVQYRYKNKDTSYSWMEATAFNHIHNPLIQGVVTISREIGKRKMLEEELKSALNLRDDFLSIASHELKTPMTSIKLQLQMLIRSKKYQEFLSENCTKSESLPHLLEQVDSLQCLIDDLLSVSKIRTGQLGLNLLKENLSAIVTKMVERYQGLFREAKCELKVDIEKDIMLACDKARIEQVFINLMSNAVKYAPNAPVSIVLITENGFAKFKISDNGPGIPEEKRDLIFGRFERLNHTSYTSGLGIGLFISKNIVEGHRGIINVEDCSGKGTSFVVCLPLA